MNRRRLISLGSALVAGTALTLAGIQVPAAQAATGATVSLAPAIDGAANGGAVIVWMTNQHANLNLKTQYKLRRADSFADQRAVVASIKAHGGTGITQLVSVNSVAANVSAAEVSRLRALHGVAKVVPNSTESMTLTAAPDSVTGDVSASQVAVPTVTSLPSYCPSDPNVPTQAEANSIVHANSADPNAADMANSIADGSGVIVANEDLDALAGDPNFQRADGSHVIIDAPNYATNTGQDEFDGDASAIAAQGLIKYDLSQSFPLAGLPTGCEFVIKGVAPGASLVDNSLITTPGALAAEATQTSETEAQIIAGIDNAVGVVHADVLSESFGDTNTPGSFASHYVANDAAVAAGATVVVSSGDSGVSGTISSPSTDPLVISAGATDALSLVSAAWGYTSWVSNNIATLSSSGTTVNNKLVDLVAPGYFGAEVTCVNGKGGCPNTNNTEAFRGTSEACPTIAGGAADVIEAYRNSHNGTSPTPVMVKELLTSTATDLNAPSDQQGSGLLDVYAAVKAAQQMPGASSFPADGDSVSLVTDPSQLDLTGQPGSTVNTSVNVYNTSNTATVVNGTTRAMGPYTQIGSTTTEAVSAPAAGTPIPQAGATAATAVTFTVPAGLDRLDAKMIWPDPTNDNILGFDLWDPNGAFEQVSYDDGAPKSGAPSTTTPGNVPDIQDGQINNPIAGKWTAHILWSGKDQDLALPPITPGPYTGNISFEVLGAHYITSQATQSNAITIPAHSTVTVPLTILMAATPGDNPESIQFSASNGAKTSFPVARRTLIPSTGGAFQANIISSVGRSIGDTSTFWMNVPAGQSGLNVTFTTADASADNKYHFYLINPAGKVAANTTSPVTVNGSLVNAATLTTTAPGNSLPAGIWEIDVVLTLTTSGNEFNQVVFGNVTAAGSEQVETTVTQQGALTLSVPNAAPVVLPTPTLSADGTQLLTNGAMNPVTITDTRQASPGWTASGTASAFTNLGGGAGFAASFEGWTPGGVTNVSGSQTVALGPVVAPTATTGGGLTNAQVLATGSAGATGTNIVGATLNLAIPASTGLGTYTSTLTITAI